MKQDGAVRRAGKNEVEFRAHGEARDGIPVPVEHTARGGLQRERPAGAMAAARRRWGRVPDDEGRVSAACGNY